MKKIVLATGIFYPDVGGPAIHVRKIAEALVGAGFRPVVVSYGDYSGQEDFPFKVIRISNKLSPLLRRFKYLLVVLREAYGARVLYAFNLATAGLPVFIAGKLLRKRVLIRVPGDPIWERTVEAGKRRISFVNYYEQGLYMVDRPWLFRIIKFILPKFDDIVFYSPFLSEIYQKYYGLLSDKVHVVLNPVTRRNPPQVSLASEPTVLFAGRFVAYKNLELVIKAFDRVYNKIGRGRLVLIGEGPDKKKLEDIAGSLQSVSKIEMISKVSQEKLFEWIGSSWFGIGPALTEFNPNFILECLSFGKPVLLSRENGLSVKLSDEFLFDSSEEDELVEKMSKLFDPVIYSEAVRTVSKLNFNQSWENVVNFHLKLISRNFVQ